MSVEFASESLGIQFPHATKVEIDCALSDVVRLAIREEALERGQRAGGRKIDQIRDISCEIDVFPSLHGSSLFSRGETQVLSSVALDSADAGRPVDEIENAFARNANLSKNFILSYEYPPYAINDVRYSLTRNRRETGHGK